MAPASEAVTDAVRKAYGRPVRPAETVEAAEGEVQDFLVVPEWYAGERAAEAAALVLDGLHGLDGGGVPSSWAFYDREAKQLAWN